MCFQAARLPRKLNLYKFIFSCCFPLTLSQPPLLQRACANDPSRQWVFKRKNGKAIITLVKWTREVLGRKSTRLWVGALLSFTLPLLLLAYACLLPAGWLIRDHRLIDAASTRYHQTLYVEIVIHEVRSSILNHTSDCRRVFAWRQVGQWESMQMRALPQKRKNLTSALCWYKSFSKQHQLCSLGWSPITQVLSQGLQTYYWEWSFSQETAHTALSTDSGQPFLQMKITRVTMRDTAYTVQQGNHISSHCSTLSNIH